MNCEKFKYEWLDYCKKVINSEKKCFRPIDCTSNDLHSFVCSIMIDIYNKKCIDKPNFS